MYKVVKRKYQLGEMTKEAVVSAIKNVCTEIHEFIHVLYVNTDMQEERTEITKLLRELSGKY